jgi:hypothetical protein
MRKLKLELSELRVESFTIASDERRGTVQARDTAEPYGGCHLDSRDTCYATTCTEVGQTQCGTCPPGSAVGTCLGFGCGSGGCGGTGETAWACTCGGTCQTCETINCGWDCTQQNCGSVGCSALPQTCWC